MRRVYLDNNSTTPLDPRVVAAMAPYGTGTAFGNPSNLHAFGRDCAEAVAAAREQVARFLNASDSEVYFTGSGTEADNWAIKGVAAAREAKGRHIITSAIEHSAVLETCRYLEGRGWRVDYLPVDGYGLVDPDDLLRVLRADTVLVTVMLVNNEIGTIEPVKEIAAICRRHGAYCHTDAVAAAGKIAVDVQELGVDLLTISAHKLNGPKGVGALFVRRGTSIHPLIHGGHQEQGMRAGTENVAGIVGLGKACEILAREWQDRARHEGRLRDRLEQSLLEKVPDLRLNGHPVLRAPNVAHFSVGYVEGEALLASLDLEGIAVASGSACSSGEAGPSATVKAIGVPPMLQNSSVRFSLGMENSEEEIDYVVDIFPRVVARLREISPISGSPVWKGRHSAGEPETDR